MKRLPVIIFIVFCLIIFVIFGLDTQKKGIIPSIQVEPSVFSKSISDLALGFESYGYVARLYPDNKHLFFTAQTASDEGYVNGYFMVNLETDAISPVSHVPLSGTETSSYFVTVTDQMVSVESLEREQKYSFEVEGSVFSGVFNPDGTKIAVNTSTGIYVFDLATQILTHVSNNRYDGAYAWIDPDYVLGFRETKENLMEAGRARVLAVWNTNQKTYTDVPVEFPYKTIRFLEWIVPGRIARVNSGFDDGSFDSIVDLSTYTVKDLGDTSGMRTGVKVDTEFKRIALLGTRDTASVLELYNEKGELLENKLFADTFVREGVQFLSDKKVIYVRKNPGAESTSDIVTFDFSTGTETLIRSFSRKLYSFALSSDKTIIIVPDDIQMILIRL